MYSAVGGLIISLLTDRVQSIAALLMIICLIVVVVDIAADQRDLQPMTNQQKGFTAAGFGSILTMPLTTMTFNLFNEGSWQRVWASASERDLRLGAIIGATLAGASVALFGLGGLIAIRAGYADSKTSSNMFFFSLFTGSSHRISWEGVVVLLAACTMSMAAVDSFMIGIQGTLSSTFCKGHGLVLTRTTMVLVNLPLILIASLGLADSALDLFNLEGMVTVTCAAPVVLAMLPFEGRWQTCYTETAALAGILGGALSLSVYGIARADWTIEGLTIAWAQNDFGYDYYLVAAGVPALVSLCWAGVNAMLQRNTTDIIAETSC